MLSNGFEFYRQMYLVIVYQSFLSSNIARKQRNTENNFPTDISLLSLIGISTWLSSRIAKLLFLDTGTLHYEGSNWGVSNVCINTRVVDSTSCCTCRHNSDLNTINDLCGGKFKKTNVNKNLKNFWIFFGYSTIGLRHPKHFFFLSWKFLGTDI